jgi:HEAT repeat protein
MVRDTATSALVRIGPAAVPALTAALKDRDLAVRSRAAMALGVLRPPPEATVPDLLAALKDPESEVREHAATALAEIRPGAAPVISALANSLLDKDDSAAGAAAQALAKIGPRAVPVLMTALKDGNPRVRLRAARALMKIRSPEVNHAALRPVLDAATVRRASAAAPRGAGFAQFTSYRK